MNSFRFKGESNLQLNHQKIRDLSRVKCWLLDMDGTITLGEELLPGADRFFRSIHGSEYIFLTNNSSHSAGHYINRMRKLGIPTDRKQMLTSTDALAMYLKQLCHEQSEILVFPVGTADFESELETAGISLVKKREQALDYVVLGFDTSLTYEKLDIACDYIRSGIPYLAANPDYVCPMPGNKVLPDCGAIIAFMETCTGKKPDKVIGKPDTAMVDMIRANRGYRPDEIAMVGDRIYTDMAVAKKAGILCIAVLSGEATAEEIEASQVEPDYIFTDVGELSDTLSICRQAASAGGSD